MRYHLRTLLILLTLGPPALAFAWLYVSKPSELLGLLTMLGILSLAYWSIFQHTSGRNSILQNPTFLQAELHRLEARRERITAQIETTKTRLREATAQSPASNPSLAPADSTPNRASRPNSQPT